MFLQSRHDIFRVSPRYHLQHLSVPEELGERQLLDLLPVPDDRNVVNVHFVEVDLRVLPHLLYKERRESNAVSAANRDVVHDHKLGAGAVKHLLLVLCPGLYSHSFCHY